MTKQQKEEKHIIQFDCTAINIYKIYILHNSLIKKRSLFTYSLIKNYRLFNTFHLHSNQDVQFIYTLHTY